jgi:2-polyprenyl-6-methoxyphenol hydroxylase-like FAD-dependent oxidoreductase
MPASSGVTTHDTLSPDVRVHIVGAGPVGLMLTALFQPMDGFSVYLYEKRRQYTRTRMVQLQPYLTADSVASYCTDYIDGESVEALFDAAELQEGLAFRHSIPPDLMALLQSWVQGFCPLNAIEHSLSELIETRAQGGSRSQPVRRTAGVVTAADAMAMLEPGDVLIDCTGKHSLLRDRLVPGDGAPGANTFRVLLEYAIMVTFLYDQAYECNEYCKYYKNIENAYYKFIPAVNRTFHDGDITHVTGIVNITAEDYERMPPQFDGEWLRANFPYIAQSMDRFITKVNRETGGQMLGDLEIVRIPMQLYHARNATSRPWHRAGAAAGDHPFARSPVFLAGDSAVGSPYFQSISLGLECAMFLAGLLAQRDLPLRDLLDRYELYAYKQWLRVYMRSKMIKHNKDVFEVLGDNFAALEMLHIY